MSIYTDNGYDSRKDYLNSLSDDYGIEIETVYVLADMLGPIEDFDGLISMLQDVRQSEDVKELQWLESNS